MAGGWVGSDRTTRRPPAWPRIRRAVRDRAGGKCEWTRVTARLSWLPQGDPLCPAYGTEADHVDRGDDHAIENLAWLCGHHHKVKTSLEGNAERWRHTAKRPPEPHPGLM